VSAHFLADWAEGKRGRLIPSGKLVPLGPPNPPAFQLCVCGHRVEALLLSFTLGPFYHHMVAGNSQSYR
jgi:hypothetical protein